MAEYTEFKKYDEVQNSDRITHGGKTFIFDTSNVNTGPLGVYKIFESRNPDSVAKSTIFTGLEPVIVTDTSGAPDPITGDPTREIDTSIDLTSISDIS